MSEPLTRIFLFLAINMTKLYSLPTRFFDKVIIERPKLIIILLLAVVSFLGYKVKDFKLDASAETLVLEHDKDLRYSRLIDSRYGLHDYLVMTYAPKGDLFSVKVLSNLTRLRDELKRFERVSSVVSILDVPSAGKSACTDKGTGQQYSDT